MAKKKKGNGVYFGMNAADSVSLMLDVKYGNAMQGVRNTSVLGSRLSRDGVSFFVKGNSVITALVSAKGMTDSKGMWIGITKASVTCRVRTFI